MRSEALMEQIRKRLSEKLGESYEVEKRTVLKNNGVEAEGFSVRKAGDVLAAVLYPGMMEVKCYNKVVTGVANEI